MSAPLLGLPAGPAAAKKKKRVLLVDTSRPKRDLRSETMRKLGMEVDCAADVAEARCWWRADLYDLVLINVSEGTGPRDRFCDDIRGATPAQQIMFLVGGPEYLATAPKADEAIPQADETAETVLAAQVNTSLASAVSRTTGHWGILEACRRISAVRHVSEARALAIRNLPLPSRDSGMSDSKRKRALDLIDPSITENLQ